MQIVIIWCARKLFGWGAIRPYSRFYLQSYYHVWVTLWWLSHRLDFVPWSSIWDRNFKLWQINSLIWLFSNNVQFYGNFFIPVWFTSAKLSSMSLIIWDRNLKLRQMNSLIWLFPIMLLNLYDNFSFPCDSHRSKTVTSSNDKSVYCMK